MKEPEYEHITPNAAYTSASIGFTISHAIATFFILKYDMGLLLVFEATIAASIGSFLGTAAAIIVNKDSVESVHDALQGLMDMTLNTLIVASMIFNYTLGTQILLE